MTSRGRSVRCEEDKNSVHTRPPVIDCMAMVNPVNNPRSACMRLTHPMDMYKEAAKHHLTTTTFLSRFDEKISLLISLIRPILSLDTCSRNVKKCSCWWTRSMARFPNWGSVWYVSFEHRYCHDGCPFKGLHDLVANKLDNHYEEFRGDAAGSSFHLSWVQLDLLKDRNCNGR